MAQNFSDLMKEINGCMECYDFDIDPAEIETLLSIGFPDYESYYSEDAQDILSGIVSDIRDGKVIEDIEYDYLDQLDLYFMIQKLKTTK